MVKVGNTLHPFRTRMLMFALWPHAYTLGAVSVLPNGDIVSVPSYAQVCKRLTTYA